MVRTSPTAGESGNSGDGFLYCRCAKGKSFYESVLADPARMPRELEEWCESLLYVTGHAWAAATGNSEEDWNYHASVSYETGCNAARWSSSSAQPEAERDPFIEPVLTRAVTRAGHAFKAKRYGDVVKLLARHEPQLSRKLQRMLSEARRLQ